MAQAWGEIAEQACEGMIIAKIVMHCPLRGASGFSSPMGENFSDLHAVDVELKSAYLKK